MAEASYGRVVLVLLLMALLLQLQTSYVVSRTSKKIYIVYLGERQHEHADLVTASHHDMLTSILGSKEETLGSIVYSYRHGFSGFAAKLTQSQARQIAGLPGVLRVTENQVYSTLTTRSWDFLGLDYKETNGLLAQARNGENIIIGVLDTGITPESLSFDDTGYGPPPSKWKGICQVGPSFNANSCNRKIIGARWYANDVPKSTLENNILSPRDIDGHGTHAASTAGGNVVHNVSFHGMAAGTAHGGASRARLAIYKVCWANFGCSGAAMLKAMDDAIHDGVDVLSLSIGAPTTEHLGSLHVVASGIPVVFGAGNDGPAAQTVDNSSPWLITVAAATMDRTYPVVITLGNNETFVAQSFMLLESARQFTEIQLYYGDNCHADNIDATVEGKMAFCFAATLNNQLQDASSILSAVISKGGRGVILPLYHSDKELYRLGRWVTAGRLNISFVPVDYEIAYRIYEYVTNRESDQLIPKAKISLTQTMIGSEISAPKVAAFSSRGPSRIYPGVLKPDIAAPGVLILAAAPRTTSFIGVPYYFNSGTSMSCPHVTGIVAVLKSIHPEWSPAALKSAIMTTALTSDNNGMPIQANGNVPKIADPFDYGAGFVNPTMAADPGLIYDINVSDYLNFFNCIGGLGAQGYCTTANSALIDLNLPSIAIPNLRTSQTAVRTVTNVGQHEAVYKAFLQPPAGVEMAVEPSVLEFNKERKVQSFKVTFKATRKVQGDYTFGSLVWHDGGNHWVRIPIAVRIVIEEIYSMIS